LSRKRHDVINVQLDIPGGRTAIATAEAVALKYLESKGGANRKPQRPTQSLPSPSPQPYPRPLRRSTFSTFFGLNPKRRSILL